MDPLTITALIVAIIGAIGGALAHVRIKSTCRSSSCMISPEIDESFKDDIGDIEESES